MYPRLKFVTFPQLFSTDSMYFSLGMPALRPHKLQSRLGHQKTVSLAMYLQALSSRLPISMFSLQVYLPINTHVDDRLPVLVWFHGDPNAFRLFLLVMTKSFQPDFRRGFPARQHPGCPSRINHPVICSPSYLRLVRVPPRAIWIPWYVLEFLIDKPCFVAQRHLFICRRVRDQRRWCPKCWPSRPSRQFS